MTARHRTLLLFAFLVIGKTFASDVPVVFALDAALSANQQVTAKAIISALVRQLPDTSETALIIFDDVVQKVVPLERGAAGKAAVIDEALNGSTASYSSNLAAGFERTLAALDGRGAAHLLLFARATLESADADRTQRNTRWVTEIMLPEAAAQGVAITLVSPESTADDSLLEAIADQPDNRTLVLTSAASLVDTLAARIAQAPLAPRTPPSALGTEQKTRTSDLSVAETGKDAVVVAVDGEVSARGIDPFVADSESDAQGDPVVTQGELNPSDSNVESAPDAENAGSGSRIFLYAALIILASMLLGLLAWFRRRKRQAPSPKREFPDSPAYLPFETTSRRRYRTTTVDDATRVKPQSEKLVDDDATRIKPSADRMVTTDSPVKPDDLPDPW